MACHVHHHACNCREAKFRELLRVANLALGFLKADLSLHGENHLESKRPTIERLAAAIYEVER
jgi:hypothetical protein